MWSKIKAEILGESESDDDDEDDDDDDDSEDDKGGGGESAVAGSHAQMTQQVCADEEAICCCHRSGVLGDVEGSGARNCCRCWQRCCRVLGAFVLNGTLQCRV